MSNAHVNVASLSPTFLPALTLGPVASSSDGVHSPSFFPSNLVLQLLLPSTSSSLSFSSLSQAVSSQQVFPSALSEVSQAEVSEVSEVYPSS